MDREEFTSFYTATFHRLVGQLYAMTGDHPALTRLLRLGSSVLGSP